MNNPIKIALTGAGGFIGQYVVSELLDRNVSVTVVGRDVSKLVQYEGRAQIVQLDLKNASEGVFKDLNSPDILLHLAWNGLPNYRALYHYEEELACQYKFLKIMIEEGLNNLLVTGTCFEYGMQSGALAESLDTCPDNPYGFAKDTLRKQLMFLKQSLAFNITWARLFYMYGEGQSSNSLLSQLQRAVVTGDKAFSMSGGEQLRDYLPVTEVARLLVELAMSQKDCGVINICSGKPSSVRGVVEQWLEKNQWQIELNLGCYPYPNYEPMAFWGDRVKLDEFINNQGVV